MLKFRKAIEDDVRLYFDWANDAFVRNNSFTKDLLKFNEHQKWFLEKLQDTNYHFYLLFNENNNLVGQVRIQRLSSETIIGISIDSKFRGNSLGSEMLNLACTDFFTKYPDDIIFAYIKQGNIASQKTFLKAKFENMVEIIINDYPSVRLSRKYLKDENS